MQKAIKAAQKHMSNFDSSHDFTHIQRVVGLAHEIYFETKKANPETQLNKDIITLGALLHDVGDRKYLKSGEDGNKVVFDLLITLGAPSVLATEIQTIVSGVSYSSEVTNLQHVRDLIVAHPELAVVQDADRLDSIGSIGIGRVFSYGAAKTTRGMEESVEMMEEKLLKLEGLMKTEPGKQMAHERSKRIKIFKEWWAEEIKNEKVGHGILGLGLPN